MEQMVNIKDVALFYKVTTKTIRNWIKAGMPCMRKGSVLRFDMQNVKAWMAHGVDWRLY